MNEELDLIKDIACRLGGAGIEYMMTGSMAMTLYAIPRMTRDIDIIVQLFPSDVDKIIDLFQKDFYIAKTAVQQAVQTQTMFNIIHTASAMKVDFIVRKDERYRLEEFSRRCKKNVQNAQVSVVTPEDLILSKLLWAKQSESQMQFRDVQTMLRSIPNLDGDYLKKWATILGIENQLNKARADA